MPGRSHLHDFFGNPSTDAFSTRSRLLRAPARCTRGADHSAYWVPTLMRGEAVDADGRPTGIVPDFVTLYYAAAGRDPSTIRPFPAGLQVVAGEPAATSPQGRKVVQWSCSTVPRVYSAEPPLCLPGERLVAGVLFPDCSNGRPTSANSRRHMAYSRFVRGRRYRVCPSSHPIAVPRLALIVAYPSGSGFGSELSSGGRFSLHADFFEAWRGRALQRLVLGCLHRDLHCGNVGQMPPEASG
jgi:Domain of unknown function (DUF1996)